ncbi:MAG: type IA DNA topoisomerase [Lactobacillaceae bacterium]|jgi:DNA topoisomerase-3|nr:type IA DNA topoisomerase [Lactobacillaceae bacterium]
MNLLILTEKPSAARNFQTALGGATGSYNGDNFVVTNLRGHVMTLKEPEEMVPNDLSEKYKKWNLKNLPWNLEDIRWQKTYVKSKNLKTGRIETTKKLLDEIGVLSKASDAVVIATDTDPSGEGQLLAWEAINAINWNGKVLRVNFMDESPKSIRKAMDNMQDVSDQSKDGEYLKGESRNRWDFLSMQITRVAAISARKQGFNVVPREGRLKSVIIWKIFEQLQTLKDYKKKPYFEVKFQDPAGHVFQRTTKEENPKYRFEKEEDAQTDLIEYRDSKVTNIKRETKHQVPGRLIDLAAVGAILAPRGYSSQEVLSTYQKMYEAQIVSYPRTEDKTVTFEQFNELLPKVDSIAHLVGVDTSLLTHRKPRPSHVKNQGSHGANRPGLKVPKSLSELSRFGKSAIDIYTTLAKNYLAMLAEDYIYEKVTAELLDYPAFKTTFNIPIKMNFKAIFDNSYRNTEDEDQDSKSDTVGPTASPFVYEGSNKKPATPTTKWIMAFLEKNDVGTGATRLSTLSDISKPKGMITDRRGKLDLTQAGAVSAALIKDTWIANPKVTKDLFTMMSQVGELKVSMQEVMENSIELFKHDMPIILDNAEKLPEFLNAKDFPGLGKVEKTEVVFNDKKVQIPKTWSGHTFTEDEFEKLLDGQTIKVTAKSSKTGRNFEANIHIGEEVYKGKKQTKIIPEFLESSTKADGDKIQAVIDGKEISYKKKWGTHTFTEEEIKSLSAGQTITFESKSRYGKTSTISGKIAEQTFRGHKYWGFMKTS